MSKFKQLINCHQHSDSSLDGAANVEDIVLRNKELGATHVALTEHGNMNSLMDLYDSTHKHGLKPIFGIELYVQNPYPEELEKLNRTKRKNSEYVHLTVHFKDEWAYQYFTKLTPKMESRAVIKVGERKPLITLEELHGAAGHITICSGCLVGLVQKWLNTEYRSYRMAEKCYLMLRDLAGKDDFFVEVFPHIVDTKWEKAISDESGIVRPARFVKNECNDWVPDGDIQKRTNLFMVEMAQKYGDKILISLDAHFATPDQKIVQDVKLGNGTDDWKFNNNLYILTSDEAAAVLKKTLNVSDRDIEEWIDNSYYWASKFDSFKIKTNKDRWVMDPLPEDYMLQLKHKIDRHGRMDWSNGEMIQRLRKEIDVIANNGKINFLNYMFTVEDVANWCKENDVLMNVRGSAGGSLLLYLLGVSAVNPLKHNLSFERFLTAGRIRSNNPPDADVDVADRDKVLGYLEDKYGDNFCRISIDMQLKLKSAIKDAERVIVGKVTDFTEAMCKTLPQSPQGVDEHDHVFGYTDADGTYHRGVIQTSESLQKWCLGEDLSDPNDIIKRKKVWESVKNMLGIKRQKSVHACGVVIADRPVQEYVPISVIGGTKITGFAPKQVERAGLLKLDFLGLNTLRDINTCLKSIKERLGQKIDPWNLPYDKNVFKEFQYARTETVFQFNTDAVKPYLVKIKPNSLDELAAVTALVRPGTLDAPAGDGKRTLAELYVDRCQGEKIEYVNKDLEPILKETYGIQLYQEQTLQIFRDIGGLSYEEAENVRRAISKKNEKDLIDAINQLRPKCIERGWTDEQVDLLGQQIKASSRYSFNKSHAISYAYVAYACMYLKYHYKLDWWKATLSNASKTEIASNFWPYVCDFTDLPDLNKSNDVFQIIGDRLLCPISILHGIGEKAYAQIIKNAPYTSLEHFLKCHIRHGDIDDSRSAVHSGLITKMIASGVMDSFYEKNLDIEDKIYKFEEIKAILKKKKKVAAVESKYTSMTELGIYYAKKQLIKIYSVDLRTMILSAGGRKGYKSGNDWVINIDREPLMVKDGQFVSYVKNEMASGRRPMLPNGITKFAVLAYVIDEKTKQYKNKTKQATFLTVDVNGYFYEEPIWPARDQDSAPTGFQDLPVLLIYELSTDQTRLFTKKPIKLLKDSDLKTFNMV